MAENEIYAFARKLGSEKILIVLNLSDEMKTFRLPVGILWEGCQEVANILNHEKYGIQDGQVDLKLLPWSGAMLE